jgi:MATE family multidrug resistance protein
MGAGELRQASEAGAAPRRIEATHARMVALALPMMLAHVTEPLLGVAATAVVGRLGDPALLGAVALGAVIFDFIFWGFGALRMGTAGQTAQAYGAGDDREAQTVLARALVVALVCGAGLVILQAPIAFAALKLAGASPAVTEATHSYFAVRIWAAPFALANFAILGAVIGRARTDIALVLQVAINAANIALALLFVLGLQKGVPGVALAAVLGEAFGVVLGLLMLLRIGARPWAADPRAVLHAGEMRRTLALNADIMIRTVALVFAFAFFTAQGARAGDATLAANAVLYNLFMVGAFFLDGFATAAEQLCGQALGSRDEAGFRRAVALALGWSLAAGAAVSAVLYLGGAAFIDLSTTSAEVRAEARAFLWLAALTPLAGAAAFAFDGVYIGATWSAAMRNLMLLALALYMAAFWLMRPSGNTGLWVALLIFLAARGLGQALAYPGLTRRAFASL